MTKLIVATISAPREGETHVRLVMLDTNAGNAEVISALGFQCVFIQTGPTTFECLYFW